jgi:NADH-quinone oxidoreductase subunit A
MTEIPFVFYLLVFVVVGFVFVAFHLLLGRLIRPVKPDPDKLTIYECGEPTIGSAWIQFDLRFYVVALLFVIFDVEVAFFFPWAVVFGKSNALANPALEQSARVQLTRELVPNLAPVTTESGERTAAVVGPTEAHDFAWFAFWDILVFFGVLLVGFAYLWKRGDLDWVRSLSAEKMAAGKEPRTVPAPTPESVEAGNGVVVGTSA